MQLKPSLLQLNERKNKQQGAPNLLSTRLCPLGMGANKSNTKAKATNKRHTQTNQSKTNKAQLKIFTCQLKLSRLHMGGRQRPAAGGKFAIYKVVPLGGLKWTATASNGRQRAPDLLSSGLWGVLKWAATAGNARQRAPDLLCTR